MHEQIVTDKDRLNEVILILHLTRFDPWIDSVSDPLINLSYQSAAMTAWHLRDTIIALNELSIKINLTS